MSPRTLKSYRRRLAQWAFDRGVDVPGLTNGDFSGAYTGHSEDLAVIEFCMHELGHFLADGGRFTDIPDDLFAWVGRHANELSTDTSDSWERDASAITYLAGKQLRFWEDAQPIAHSSLKNHQRLLTLPEFSTLFYRALKDKTNISKASEMATYVRLIRRNYNPKCSSKETEKNL